VKQKGAERRTAQLLAINDLNIKFKRLKL